MESVEQLLKENEELRRTASYWMEVNAEFKKWLENTGKFITLNVLKEIERDIYESQKNN